MTAGLVINGRFRNQPLTGVQRVAGAILEHLQPPYDIAAPRGRLPLSLGHAWEQAVLPWLTQGRLLWSPCNVGPVSVARQVVTIHDAAVLDHPEWFSRSFVQVYRLIWKGLVARGAKLVTVSSFSRDRLCSHFGLRPDQIRVVHNAASESFGPQSPDRVTAARSRFGLGDRPYFITLGTLEPRKNLRLVLEAWARRSPAKTPGAQLAMVGGAGSSSIFRADSREDSAAQEDILWLGRVDDEWLPALLAGSQGLIYPSLYEGFGLPVLEAMKCGAPVITTRCGSLPEVAGSAALYVDERDPEDLARAMERLAGSSDLRTELGAMGLRRADAFSWNEAADQMARISVRNSKVIHEGRHHPLLAGLHARRRARR